MTLAPDFALMKPRIDVDAASLVRHGPKAPRLDRKAFEARFRDHFADLAFEAIPDAVDAVVEAAWTAYEARRKAPHTTRAGDGYADPDYELSTEWVKARKAIDAARAEHDKPSSTTRVVLLLGGTRNEATCPSEMSKTQRLAEVVRGTLETESCEVDLLDLSEMTASPTRTIHPCKACLSTAMPLCHWPCSCYPNHSLDQVGDWMNELYPRLVRAHAILIITPVYWNAPPAPLKALMDRLSCANGGNPDPTSTQGKKPDLAKQIELDGWDYPQHLDGRAYGVIVHGDAEGIRALRTILTDFCDALGMIASGYYSQLHRYIGYYEPYATSHQTLDADEAFFEECRNAARAVARTTHQLRKDGPPPSTRGLRQPRPK